MGYLLLDKRQFITILCSSYLQLIHDINLCGRALWRHNLDTLYIRAGLCDGKFTRLSPTAKWPTRWSGSLSCQPLWLSPNASIGKSDLAGWKATCAVISLTFYTWIGWVRRKTISSSGIPEGKPKGHRASSYFELSHLSNLHKVESSFFSDVSSYKMVDICAFYWLFIHFAVCRMPLIKGKTARQALQEQGLWEEYRKKHPYNPMVKFTQTGTEPMTNDADVSPSRLTDINSIVYHITNTLW